MKKRVLIIEDDKSIAELERDYLEINGFSCTISGRGDEGLELALNEQFDVIIVDVMLPGMDGFEICTRIREKKEIPVIFLSARSEDIDKIRGLGLGADDYMTKPFSPNELVARVKAHISRRDRLMDTGRDSSVINVRHLSIDTASREVRVEGRPVSFTAKEYDLLLFLAQHPGRTYSKEQLFDRIWGMDAFGDISTVTVHIQRIRDKINVGGDKLIETVWGVGYRFKA